MANKFITADLKRTKSFNSCEATNGGFNFRFDYDYNDLNEATGSAGDIVYVTALGLFSSFLITRFIAVVDETFGAGTTTLYAYTGNGWAGIANLDAVGPRLAYAGGIANNAINFAGCYGADEDQLVIGIGHDSIAPGAFTQGSVRVYLSAISLDRV